MNKFARRNCCGLAHFTGLLACSLVLNGCAHVPNQFAEDGPASVAGLESDTTRDLNARVQACPERSRNWAQSTATPQSGASTHWPLWMEDPFEDKGTDRPDGPNKYHLGWEDFVAAPYGLARYHLNFIALPVSAVVQPPWKVMQSDGELSPQALGYDHDAEAVD